MSSPNIGSVDLSTSPLSIAARKRQATGTPVYSPNETLNQMTQEAEARQQDKYTAQREIRAIRAKEMEKQRREDEERERDEANRINRAISINSSKTSTSSSKPRLYSSTNSNSRFDESSEENPKELKKKMNEMEEKFKKHAMFQTQLENDNQKLIYEVDLLKDLIEEHQELIIELRRQFKEKSKELDYQKRSNKDLQTDFIRLKEILKQRDALIEESGLKLYTDYEVKKTNAFNNKINDSENNVNEIKSVLPAVLLAPDTAKLLDLLGDGTIDDKLRKLFNEKQELEEHNAKLLSEVDEERQKSVKLEKKLINSMNKLSDNQETSQELQDIQRQYTKEINDLKMKLQKVEHENIIIKQDKTRLDTQLKYLQTNFDQLESTEQRLIKEKREAQRELNDSKRLINELQLKLEVLQKTLDRKRQTAKIIDSSYQTIASSSNTSLISTQHNSNSNPIYISSSSSAIFTGAQESSVQEAERKKSETDKTERSSTPSQQEYSSSPTSSSASSSSSASPSSQQNKQTEASDPVTPNSAKTLDKKSDFCEENNRDF